MRTGARLVEGLLLRPQAEESVWLVEQRAAVVTKPGARWPCLAKKKSNPGASRLSRGYEKIPSIGLVVWTGMLSLQSTGKRCHQMLLNHQMNGGKSAVFISKC